MQRSLGQLIEGPPAERASDADLGRFLSPLRIRYETDEFSLPVRLGLLNSIGEQDLVVHILSPQGRFEVANYGNRWVPTNVHVNGRAATNFGRFYDAFFGALSGRAPRRVWTEYAGPIVAPAPCVGCARPALAQDDLDALGESIVHPSGASRLNDYTLTRLHYRYGRRGLPNDLVFRPARAMQGGSSRRRRRASPGGRAAATSRTTASASSRSTGGAGPPGAGARAAACGAAGPASAGRTARTPRSSGRPTARSRSAPGSATACRSSGSGAAVDP